jgi:hypothetical protein
LKHTIDFTSAGVNGLLVLDLFLLGPVIGA